VLVTTENDADRDALLQSAEAAGLSEKVAPADIVKVEELPRTEAGRIDYARVSDIARTQKNRARAA
jgi:acyl-coenzyme A synthetase/AMP-(fatty) acid ligase